jgi:hypothetical protein
MEGSSQQLNQQNNFRINEPVRKLIFDLGSRQPTAINHGDRLRVDETHQSIYTFYEKLRNSVQYKEQHLFLRNAIERFLTRQWRMLGKTDSQALALVTELIKTRYIENNSVSIYNMRSIDQALLDYQKLSVAIRNYQLMDDKIYEQVIEIASSEIDRMLIDRIKEESYVHFVFHSFLPRISHKFYQDSSPRSVQYALFSSIHRLLMKSDAARIRYYLFYNHFPYWRSNIEQTALAFASFSDEIQPQIRGADQSKISKVIRGKMPPFRLLWDVLRDENRPDQILLNWSVLEGQLLHAASSAYRRINTKLKNAIIRSIVFIFLTKISLAFLVELPYDLLFEDKIGWLQLALNIIFPPLFMIFIATTIRRPNPANTNVLVSQVYRLLQTEPAHQKAISPRKNSKRFFGFIYSAMFILSVGLLIFGLIKLDFNIVSGLLFFIFFSTVCFFGMRITSMSREYTVVADKASFFGMFFDIFYTPFVRIGQWLSDSYSRFNIFATLLDVFIELPFKSVLGIFEEWSKYLREKQDDLL